MAFHLVGISLDRVPQSVCVVVHEFRSLPALPSSDNQFAAFANNCLADVVRVAALVGDEDIRLRQRAVSQQTKAILFRNLAAVDPRLHRNCHSPASEQALDARLLSEFLRQIGPLRICTCSPKYGVQNLTMIAGGPALPSSRWSSFSILTMSAMRTFSCSSAP